MRILGIDPGLNHTGFGVIDCTGNHVTFVCAGCIHVPSGNLGDRLGFIHTELSKVINETHPDQAVCELVFVNINPKSTLLLGQARGAAIACAAVHGLPVEEYTPASIKEATVGSGRATKEQVQIMVARLLSLEGELQSDAADALACALTYANNMKLKAYHKLGTVSAQTGTRSFGSVKSKRRAWEQLVNEKLHH